MLKLKRQVIRALNIKVGNTLGQMELVHDFYKNSLDDVLNSNINNTVASTIDMNPCPLMQITSATQPEIPFDVPLLSRLFNEAASGGDKNSSPSAKRNSSPTLPSIIVSRELSNLLLRPSDNYGKLRKEKPRAVLTSRGLKDSSYITDQSGSQKTSDVSKSNANGTENSWRNQTQKSSSVVRDQKGDIRSDLSKRKLKSESSMGGNLICDDSNLILVGN